MLIWASYFYITALNFRFKLPQQEEYIRGHPVYLRYPEIFKVSRVTKTLIFGIALLKTSHAYAYCITVQAMHGTFSNVIYKHFILSTQWKVVTLLFSNIITFALIVYVLSMFGIFGILLFTKKTSQFKSHLDLRCPKCLNLIKTKGRDCIKFSIENIHISCVFSVWESVRYLLRKSHGYV